MVFDCFDVDSGRPIGQCTLPAKRYDLVGTEHMFGDTLYTLVSTVIGSSNNMYFRRKKA